MGPAQDETFAQQAPENPLMYLDSDQLLSAMTLADREENNVYFRICRNELMYRLRCAEPLINWSKPTRRGQ